MTSLFVLVSAQPLANANHFSWRAASYPDTPGYLIDEWTKECRSYVEAVNLHDRLGYAAFAVENRGLCALSVPVDRCFSFDHARSVLTGFTASCVSGATLTITGAGGSILSPAAGLARTTWGECPADPCSDRVGFVVWT